MKKLLLLFVAVLQFMTASAYDLQDDKGIQYNIKGDGTLEVVGLASWTTVADILSDVTIWGKKYEVTSIGAWAFEGREDITYLSIPWTVKSIGEYAFIFCGSSMTVNIADPECWCQMKLGNEHSSPLSSAGRVLVHDIETTTIDIPETVTAIENFTFYQCRKITSLNIPGTVTSIGSSAFEDCSGLSSLTLKDGLRTIGGSAFEGCTGLTYVSIPSTVNTIKLNAFKNCNSITDVYCYATSVPNTDAAAFDGASTGNATLHVPNSAIGAYRASWPWSAFKNIVSYDAPPIVDDTKLIDDKGINYKVKGDGTLEVTGLASWTTVADILSDVTIGGKKYRVTSIGAWAFEGREDITYLSIPWTVKSIGEYAFIFCGSSMTVNIADPECWCQMELGNEHSSPLSSAGKVLVHDIETTSIDIPTTVTSIGNFTFYQCRKITSLNIPGTVTSIGSSAFEDCTGLTSLNLNEGLQSIGGSAFEGCTGLRSVSIPSTVNTIKLNAFKNCTGLERVDCYTETVPSLGDEAFEGVWNKATLRVLFTQEGKYLKTYPWNLFSNITHLPFITYIIDGEVYDKVPVRYGDVIELPEVAQREGYVFAWGEHPYVMPDKDVIIEGSYVATSINAVKTEATDTDMYSINGYRTSKLQRGLNIIRQKDGKVRKVMVR